MIAQSVSEPKYGGQWKRAGLFPICILTLYGALYFIAPEKTRLALQADVKILVSLCIPLAFVFVVLFLVNILLRPSQVARLLGKHSGVKGILLPVVAGIISAGPIFAWYPLLKKLKSEGAGEGPIAIFLYNRAVKPFLLPVMIGFYGGPYVLVLTFLMTLGSIVVGFSMEVAGRRLESALT